jgi:hypothetical protein
VYSERLGKRAGVLTPEDLSLFPVSIQARYCSIYALSPFECHLSLNLQQYGIGSVYEALLFN